MNVSCKISNEAKLLIYSSFIIGLTQGFMWVDFPVYLDQIGYTPFQIGIILTFNTFIGALLMLPIGSLSDKYGRKKFIVLARLISSLAFIILTFFTGFFEILLAASLMGIAFANSGSSYMALLTEKSEESTRNTVFAFSSFISGVATSAGMLLGAVPPYLSKFFQLSLVNSYRVLYVIALIGSLISLLPILKIKESYRGHHGKIILFPKASKNVVIRLSVLGMIGLGAGVLVRIFPLWFYLRYNTNVNVLGPLFSITQFLTAVASLTTPSMAKVMGEIKTIVYTESTSIAILIAMPFMPLYYLAGVLYVLRSLLMNMSAPIQNSFIMSLIPENERALASSIINFFDSLPRSFGPFISGLFIQLGYLNLPFFFTATLYSFSVAGFYILFRRAKENVKLSEKIQNN
ncbi:MAG: MFS transporter [Nitrososphaeria archaeon]